MAVDVYIPDGDGTQEFDCPEKFRGGLVVSAVYVKRIPGQRPFYVAVCQDVNSNTLSTYNRCYCVARLIDTGESLGTDYAIPSLRKALVKSEKCCVITTWQSDETLKQVGRHSPVHSPSDPNAGTAGGQGRREKNGGFYV